MTELCTLKRQLTEERQARQAAELRLAEKTALMDSLLGNTDGLAVIIAAPDLTITHFNPGAEKIFHRSAGDVMGSSLTDICLFEFAPQGNCALALENAREHGSTVFNLKQGNGIDTRQFQIRLIALRNSQETISGYGVFLTDITDKARAEQRMELQSEALEAAADAIGLIDKSGRILWANKAFETLTGYTKAELIGKNPRVLKSGKHPASFYQDLWKTVTAGKVWQKEIINRRKDNSLYVEEMTITPVQNALGRVEDYIVIKRDISRHKKAQEELRKSKEAAESANQAKSEFLANMSHEIRTPLNGAMGMLSLLEDSQLTPKQQEYVDMAAFSMESLLTIINDILDFSKIEAGMLALEATPFHLEQDLERLIIPFTASAEEKQLELLLSVDPRIPQMVIGDRVRLKQILDNLLSNAFKFTRQGHVRVNVQLDRLTDRGAHLCIQVEDTGIGIPHEKQEQIFDYFTQADTSITRKFGGTGLGLAICRRLSSLMDARLSVASTPGQGSAFTLELCLPVTDTAPIALPCFDILSFQRVLILDDNPTARNDIDRCLDHYQIQHTLTATFFDALSALEKAHKTNAPFDIAVIDNTITGMEGKEFAALVRTRPHLADTRLILTGPRTLLNQADRLQALGFRAVIPKPSSCSTFMAILGLTAASTAPGLITPERFGPKRDPMDATTLDGEGLSLLLAEDNPINQKAAQGILIKIGFSRIDLAPDGRRAVEMVRSKDYDLVLMDVQMPGMDGLEATRKIRQWEKDQRRGKRHTPIIALTANAMTGDRDTCLEAGMDAHITKPIRRDTLVQVLRKWVSPVTGQPTIQAVPPTVNEEEETLPVFDREAALDRYEGDGQVLQMILDEFIQQAREMIPAIGRALEEGDWQAAAADLHALKGGASYIEAKRFLEAARDMEAQCLSPEPETARALFARLETELKEFETQTSQTDLHKEQS